MDGEKLDIIDFKNMLLVKNQLVYRTVEELEVFCEDEEKYATFLDSIALLINYDEGFLRLDKSFVLKIEEIIGKYRFVFKDSDYLATVNGIICQLNLLKTDSELTHTSKLEHYLCWQEDARMVYFDTKEDLIITVADDAVVYHMMETGEKMDVPPVTVYSSLNYFVEVCPEVLENKEFYQRSVDYLNARRQKILFRRAEKQYVSEVKENIQKVKKDC